jgi:hypothetical protein
MKATLIKSLAMGLGAAAVLSASIVSVLAATPEERAKCKKMIEEMGASAPHVHSSDKGQGPSQMSMEHSRCLAILNDGQKKDEKK